MIVSILWKECREQLPAWIGLASVGAAAFLGVPLLTLSGGLAEHPETRDALCVLAGPVAWTYGLICGAMLLVMEREVGTQPFLDALPGWRLRLWLAKSLAGIVLVVAQVAALTALAAAGQVFDDWPRLAGTVGWMLAAGLCGLAWGLAVFRLRPRRHDADSARPGRPSAGVDCGLFRDGGDEPARRPCCWPVRTVGPRAGRRRPGPPVRAGVLCRLGPPLHPPGSTTIAAAAAARLPQTPSARGLVPALLADGAADARVRGRHGRLRAACSDCWYFCNP